MGRQVVLFYPHLVGAGGAERLLLEELAAFRGAGWESRLAAFHVQQEALFDRDDIHDAIDIIGHRTLPAKLYGLRRYLKARRPDLVVAHAHNAVWYLWLAGLGLGIPYVSHIHGTLFWFHDETLKYALVNRKAFAPIRESLVGHREFIPEEHSFSPPKRIVNEVLAMLDQFSVRRSKAIITLTEQLQWEIRQLYGRASIVARGCLDEHMLARVDGNRSRQTLNLPPGRMLLSVGRLDPRKRVDVIVRAFAQVSDEFPDAYLVVGGTGPERESLGHLVATLGLGDRVRFTGFIPDRDLPAYYAACDVFVFPSWTSSGITPYEALAQGARVVLTSEASEPILDDPNVFVADPDPGPTAEAIRKALAAPEVRPSDVRDYSWAHYFEPILAVGDKIVGPSSTPSVARS